MLPFAWFYYIQQNQTEFKVDFWNKPPIAHTYNFITTRFRGSVGQLKLLSRPTNQWCCPKNEVGEREVGERLEIEVKTVAKSAFLQEFCIV